MNTHTKTPARNARVAALVAGLLIIAGLTGCFPADTDGGADATPAPTATATENVAGLPEGVQQATDVPLDVPNRPELRGVVELAVCDAVDGGWQAAGTVTNSATESRDYTITIFFTTEGGTVIGTGDTEVSVAGGESEEWSVAAELTPAPGTNCVLRGVG
jgi:hypothetical protein